MLIVAKFGGSSLADAARFRAVGELVRSGRQRGIVVSAPGSRFPGDAKLTDLLFRLHDSRNGDFAPIWEQIEERILSIAEGLSLSRACKRELYALKKSLHDGTERAFLASRGEYFSAKLLAEYLDRPFVDSADWLCFTPAGRVDTARSYGKLWARAQEPFVTPGFYGALPDGKIYTFPRGGSDITGSLAAAALDADLCENRTDVPGVLQADPKLLPWAQTVPALTYSELAELGALGVQVLHEGAIAPLRQSGIPLRICSTFSPDAPGTYIAETLPAGCKRQKLLTLAAKGGRALLTAEEGLFDWLSENKITPDFYTRALGKETAAVGSEAVHGETLPLHTAHIRDGIALVAVLYDREAPEGLDAAGIFAALAREKIAVRSVFRPFGGHTLLLAADDAERIRILRTILPE